EAAVIEAGDLHRAQGVLVAALASSVNSLFGATEDYAFTRELARMASPQQLQRLLRACVAVGAADGELTAAESTELYEIGRELGVNAEELDAIREQVHPDGADGPSASARAAAE
ncbi:MAG: TerB family tellurite resistance protein, partial [Candidatus Limnocylindrales bacterium]